MDYEVHTIADNIKNLNKTTYLPAIQKEFVWETYRIEKLFDSIMGDYPMGAMLF